MNEPSYPPVGFFFQLSFSGSPEKSASFTEASGINASLEVEEVYEGGENRFDYRIPKRYTRLTLKRGVMPKDSEMAKWCFETLGRGIAQTIKPKEIKVSLLDTESKVLSEWVFVNAYPVLWSISDFGSVNNEIAVESMEFAYNTYFRKL